jgi:hypothetical protein
LSLGGNFGFSTIDAVGIPFLSIALGFIWALNHNSFIGTMSSELGSWTSLGRILGFISGSYPALLDNGPQAPSKGDNDSASKTFMAELKPLLLQESLTG